MIWPDIAARRRRRRNIARKTENKWQRATGNRQMRQALMMIAVLGDSRSLHRSDSGSRNLWRAEIPTKPTHSYRHGASAISRRLLPTAGEITNVMCNARSRALHSRNRKVVSITKILSVRQLPPSLPLFSWDVELEIPSLYCSADEFAAICASGMQFIALPWI